MTDCGTRNEKSSLGRYCCAMVVRPYDGLLQRTLSISHTDNTSPKR